MPTPIRVIKHFQIRTNWVRLAITCVLYCAHRLFHSARFMSGPASLHWKYIAPMFVTPPPPPSTCCGASHIQNSALHTTETMLFVNCENGTATVRIIMLFNKSPGHRNHHRSQQVDNITDTRPVQFPTHNSVKLLLILSIRYQQGQEICLISHVSRYEINLLWDAALWRCSNTVVHNVSKDCCATLDCSALQSEATWNFESSGAIYPTTQRSFPGHLNP